MEVGSVVGSIDVAQVTLYAFWVFFAGLLWYLRQEDRREGYPLEDDISGRYNRDPWLFLPRAKTFILGYGQGTVSVPNADARDTREIRADRTASFSGASLRPTGNPIVDGIGPASWAVRADLPDLTAGGDPRIVPMHVAEDFVVAPGGGDFTGLRVVACDQVAVGTVAEYWVDRSEDVVRYLDVALYPQHGARTVLLPVNFSIIKRGRAREEYLYVHALSSGLFAGVPGTALPDRITRLEEEKVVAYYGGGQLYATPARQEAIL